MKRITTAYPPLTEAEIDAMLVDARRHGPANCWTGTKGTLAAHIVRLVADREQHRADGSAAADGANEGTTEGQSPAKHGG